jgi:hypothetical protein
MVFFVPSTLSSRSDFCTLYVPPKLCWLHEIQNLPKKPKLAIKAKIGQKGQKKFKKAKFAKKKKKPKLGFFGKFWIFWIFLDFLEQVAVCHFGDYIDREYMTQSR